MFIIVSYRPLIGRAPHHHPLSSPPNCLPITLSSYLQPGGEREWKVDRENISALSAIFFHKWLRATAENHGWSAVHSQSQGRGQSYPRTEALSLSVSAALQMPPGRKPSIRRACSAPSNLQSTIHTSRAGRKGRVVGYQASKWSSKTVRNTEEVKKKTPPVARSVPAEQKTRTVCDRSPRFFLPECLLTPWCCCLWHTTDTGQQCGDRQRQRRRGCGAETV